MAIKNVLEFHRRLQRGQQHVRPDIAHQEIDLVCVDQLVGLLLTELWLELVVFVNHLDRQSAHRPANVVEPKLERIAHVFADCRSGAGECAHKTDFHRLALGKCRSPVKASVATLVINFSLMMLSSLALTHLERQTLPRKMRAK